MGDKEMQTTSSNPLAVTSLVLGIIGALGQVVFWIYIPGVLALLAVLFGFRARRRASAGAARGTMATWGLSLGVLGVVANLVLGILGAVGVFAD